MAFRINMLLMPQKVCLVSAHASPCTHPCAGRRTTCAFPSLRVCDCWLWGCVGVAAMTTPQDGHAQTMHLFAPNSLWVATASKHTLHCRGPPGKGQLAHHAVSDTLARKLVQPGISRCWQARQVRRPWPACHRLAGASLHPRQTCALRPGVLPSQRHDGHAGAPRSHSAQ